MVERDPNADARPAHPLPHVASATTQEGHAETRTVPAPTALLETFAARIEGLRRTTQRHIEELAAIVGVVDRSLACHVPLADRVDGEVAEPALRAIVGLARAQALQAAYYDLRAPADALFAELASLRAECVTKANAILRLTAERDEALAKASPAEGTSSSVQHDATESSGSAEDAQVVSGKPEAP